MDDARDRERRAFRLEVIRRESPVILAGSGALVLVLTVLNYVVPPRGEPVEYAVTLVVGLLFLAAAAIMRVPAFPSGARPWMVTAMVVVLVYLLLLEYRPDPRPVNLAWAIGVMLAFMPAVDDRPAAMVGSALTYGGFVVALLAWDVPDAIDFIMVGGASLVIGGILLERRLRTLDALADAQTAALHGASTDPLTGVFNRRGLVEHLGALAAIAARLQQPYFAVFVDVRGLKLANDAHGHDYGDDVIRTVARAVEATVREIDVVARWGGDEFVVVGVGESPTPEEVEGRVHAFVARADIDLTKWAGLVTAGVASGQPGTDELTDVISSADTAMYRRRAQVGRPASEG